MKNTIFFMAIAAMLLLMSSCKNEVNLDEVLQKETTRQQVFEKIVADHEMMTAFMEVMMKDNHAMMMMKGHEGMKKMMMGEGDMMQMMKDKPEMMHSMMGKMMKDGKMMGHMMQMMKKEGMMSEDCMQSCMKMMGDKGMKVDSLSGSKNEDSHESHNH